VSLARSTSRTNRFANNTYHCCATPVPIVNKRMRCIKACTLTNWEACILRHRSIGQRSLERVMDLFPVRCIPPIYLTVDMTTHYCDRDRKNQAYTSWGHILPGGVVYQQSEQ
jgi:hypothetical protein